MNFLARRRYRKLVKHVLHESRHARNMREDVADEADVAMLIKAEAALKAAWQDHDATRIDEAIEQISETIERVQPPRSNPRLRENIEIIAVAVAVARARARSAFRASAIRKANSSDWLAFRRGSQWV